MIRLLMACIVAYSLMPANMSVSNTAQNSDSPKSSLTTQDTLSAVQSTFSDVMGFCDRNVEACLTAQTLAGEAKQKAMQALNSLSKTENDIGDGNDAFVVEEKTSSQNNQ